MGCTELPAAILDCPPLTALRGLSKYLDKEEHENELKQVLGDTYISYDLGDDGEGLLVMGSAGCLFVIHGFIQQVRPVLCHSPCCLCVQLLVLVPFGPTQKGKKCPMLLQEHLLTSYLTLASLDSFVRNFFNRTFILTDMLKEIREDIDGWAAASISHSLTSLTSPVVVEVVVVEVVVVVAEVVVAEVVVVEALGTSAAALSFRR